MQTRLPETLRCQPQGEEMERILRSCVHCGFCNATCPTYQLLGDERDGPRGRIYLIKQALETGRTDAGTLQHLDRCLQCRNCETTCPSGVQYTRLLELARPRLLEHAPYRSMPRLHRWLLRKLLPHRVLNRPLFALAAPFRPLLPAFLRRHLPARVRPARFFARPAPPHVVLFQGCVESTLMGDAHRAAARLFKAAGFNVLHLKQEGCCGAIEHHLDAHTAARRRALANVAQWRHALQAGADAIVFLSSACELQVRHYPSLLGGQAPDDLDAILKCIQGLDLWLDRHRLPWTTQAGGTVAWHPPCTLQHGLRRNTHIPALLEQAGYTVLHPDQAHLCCGAAGTYSLLQREISQSLGRQRRAALDACQPQWITTANIGCLLHLQRDSGPPVLHWATLLARRLEPEGSPPAQAAMLTSRTAGR